MTYKKATPNLKRSSEARARQCQTGDPLEETTYVVHYGEWVECGDASSFHARERCFSTEDEACEHALGRLHALAGLTGSGEGAENLRIKELGDSIWVERRTTISQSVGFDDAQLRRGLL